ncbi:MAG: FecR domain-containing protein [Bacteroidota bacterium]
MKVNPELLEKYANGNCTEAERQAVEKWLVEHDNVPKIPLSNSKLKAERQQVWQEITESLGAPKPTLTRPLYKRISKYAAVLAMALSLGFLTYYFINDNKFNSPTNDIAFEDYQTISNDRGKRKTVELPDGTTVWLNHDTKIKFPKAFEGAQRIVHLQGHAHFDVVRNPDKPFVIYTKESKTKVLGTSFDVNTRGGKGATEVIVTSGKVAFSENADDGNIVFLKVNERALLKRDTPIAKSIVDAQTLTAWKDNQLILKGKNLEQILAIVEPWYDVQVTVKNPEFLQMEFNISLDNPSLETLMDDLSFIGQFTYAITNSEVIIE